MKIKVTEERILHEGLTDELLQEYEKALRRSNSDYNRQQNCYILGYNLRERDYAGALRLMEFAMQRYQFTFPGDRRRGYEMLAHIHRDNGRVDMAKQYLQVARELLGRERTLLLADGSSTRFDKILIATGASPFVPLPAGYPAEDVYVMRTPADADRLRARLGRGARREQRERQQDEQ